MLTSSHSIRFRVRYAETDQGGIAHHSIYPVWFEMGRVEMMRQTGITYRDMELEGFFFVIVELQIKYRRPARFDEELELATKLAAGTKVTMEHEYELHRIGDEEPLATGKSLVACTNRTGRPCRIPATAFDAINRRYPLVQK
jgi:acyl-CoA thioester hydrolase